MFKLPKNQSSRKTIYNIVIVYFITSILLILIIGIIYFKYQKQQFLHIQQQQGEVQSNIIIQELKTLHKNYINNNFIVYPKFISIKTAIYDIDKNLIFSSFKENIKLPHKKIFYKNNFLYLIYKIEPYYIGASYLVIQQPIIFNEAHNITIISIIISVIILFLLVISIILAKMLIKPLSNNIQILDKFIKDTTHELNTPISAILTNIEMLDYTTLTQKNIKKINRIKIGATTISTIYDDLSFLLLNDKQKSNNIILNISDILKQRIEYFMILAKSKRINFNVDIKDNIYFTIDKLKIERMIDNIISNSIKYSNINTSIDIILNNNSLVIKDNGIGMDKNEIDEIFIRYKRFNNSNGGFGIGYDIINSIIKEYNINIDIKSQKNKGTKVTLKW